MVSNLNVVVEKYEEDFAFSSVQDNKPILIPTLKLACL